MVYCKTEFRCTTGELAKLTRAELVGDPSVVVEGVCAFDEPKSAHITFCNAKTLERIAPDLVQAGVAACLSEHAPSKKFNLVMLLVSDPARSMLDITHKFFRDVPIGSGIDPSAVIHPSARLGRGVVVGPFCYIAEDVLLEDAVVLYPRVTIYPRSVIGRGTTVHSGVVIREDCRIGAGCLLHSSCVIGADGFGFMPDKGLGLRKIPQVGRVVIGDDCEIGANACVDRATFGTTYIARGTKIDNLVQVGHNVKIGEHSIICALSGIGGSTRLGRQVVIGGTTGVADHLHIADGVRVGGHCGVAYSLKEKGDYAGYPAVPANQWRREVVALRRIPNLLRKLASKGRINTKDE